MKHQLYLEELYKISLAMSSEHNLEKLLELIMISSIKVTNADEGSLMLLDKLSQTLRIMVAKGSLERTKESVVIKIGEPIAGLVAKDGKPIVLSDELLEKRFDKVHHEGRRIKSAISLPLKVKDKVIGVLNLNIVEGNGRFTEDDLVPLAIFASQAAIAIENARLYSATTKRTQELLILNRAGKILSSTFQEEEVINIITSVIGEIVEFDVVASLLLETGECSTLRLISFCKLNNKAVEAVKDRFIAVLSELTDWGFEKNQMIINKEIRKKEGAASSSRELESHLVFPLVAKEKVIGAISIHSFRPHAFSEEHIHSLSILAPQAAIALENAKIYIKMQSLYTETIKALSAEIETRNPYTLGHSERVTDYSVNIAKRMGLSSAQVELIRYAGLLHDLGKIGISDSILLKPDKLTQEEFNEIKNHPTKSESIIKMITFLKDTLPIVRHHHEYYDGKGYPDGLKEYEIPIESRILAVADAFDAMTSDRPYRQRMKKEEAYSILKKFSGQQFDPDVVEAFVALEGNISSD
jgi:HD-GYP domain-containing protein (c-di-GMP phosphodiesterase class II)